jgi:hypothetical protein
MLPLKLPGLLYTILLQQLNCQDNKAKDKNKNTDPVDPVHIPDPFIFWPVGVFLF